MTVPSMGYTCSTCGTFVLNGAYHVCGGTPQWPPVYTPLPSPQNEAVVALTAEITRLRGIIHKANDERDKAIAERMQAERDEQEWRGIVETYGRAERHSLMETDEEVLTLKVNSWVLRSAGKQNAALVFIEGMRKMLDNRFANGSDTPKKQEAKAE